MDGTPRSDDDTDIAWCHDAVQDVSRTFALTVESLEEPMATHICLGYLLCRVPDTVEDAGHIPPAEKAALLETYERSLDPAAETTIETFVAGAEPWLPPEGERSDDWRVVAEAPRIKRAFEKLPAGAQQAIIPPVMELVEGMGIFVKRHADSGGLRIDTKAEIDEYCYYAAGTVGNLITNLLARGGLEKQRRQTLYETAGSFGLLLQLVNIAKDVYDDYTEENNVYLPASWLAEEGVPQEELLDPDHREGAATVVGRTARYAESFLDDAETYLKTMPLTGGNTLAAWGVPFLLSVATLRELTAAPADSLTEHEVKVSRMEVYAVLEAMRDADRDDLPEFRSVIAREPFHEAMSSASLD